MKLAYAALIFFRLGICTVAPGRSARPDHRSRRQPCIGRTRDINRRGHRTGARHGYQRSGRICFQCLTPARYTVTVVLPGFKKLERKGIEVITQTAATIDLTLELGPLNESVNVVAEAPGIETSNASNGQLLDSQQITDLPIPGRNPFFEGKLAQGVVYAANPKFARMQDQDGRQFAGLHRRRPAAHEQLFG